MIEDLFIWEDGGVRWCVLVEVKEEVSESGFGGGGGGCGTGVEVEVADEGVFGPPRAFLYTFEANFWFEESYERTREPVKERESASMDETSSDFFLRGAKARLRPMPAAKPFETGCCCWCCCWDLLGVLPM